MSASREVWRPPPPGSRRVQQSMHVLDGICPHCRAPWKPIDGVLSGVDGGGTTASEAIERLLATQIALRNIAAVWRRPPDPADCTAMPKRLAELRLHASSHRSNGIRTTRRTALGFV